MNTTSPISVSPVSPANPPSSNALPAPALVSDAPPVSSQAEQPSPGVSWWKVFGTTFITIFLAEMGDKTQVATLLITAESHSPWLVFTGAAVALICTSLIGVLLGRWLSSRLSARTLDIAAGLTLAAISLGLLWDVVHH
ncbi:MAG: TMEM165/GDT1 family protein [Leptolyngbyaceae cyanobacterium]